MPARTSTAIRRSPAYLQHSSNQQHDENSTAFVITQLEQSVQSLADLLNSERSA